MENETNPAGVLVDASGLPAWVDGLRDFMLRNGKTTEDVGNVLIAAGFATRGVVEAGHQTKPLAPTDGGEAV